MHYSWRVRSNCRVSDHVEASHAARARSRRAWQLAKCSRRLRELDEAGEVVIFITELMANHHQSLGEV